MQVAVPGMEDVGDAETVAGGQLADPPQREGQLAHRDHPVEAEVVGDLPHRPEGGLAPLPDQRGDSSAEPVCAAPRERAAARSR